MRKSPTIAIVQHFCAALILGSAIGAQAQGSPALLQYFPAFVAGTDPVLRADGTTVIAGGLARTFPSHTFAVVGLSPDGTPDRGFGAGGIVKLTVWGASESARYLVARADGKLLVSGIAIDPSVRCTSQRYPCPNRFIALFRLNPDGVRDSSFGDRGRVVFSVADGDGHDLTPGTYQLSPQPDGTTLIEGVADPYGDPRPITVRVLADGGVDASASGTDYSPVEARFTVAVEFRHVLLDHYFVTADATEIAGLDRDEQKGWVWEGDGFRVYPAGSFVPNTVPVCRFYGRPEAGIDSHFLSANALECAALEASGDGKWILESREAFRVELPDAYSGRCTAGDSASIYRLWNARVDSNHFFTNRKAMRDWYATGRGYVSEGWGPDGVAMCAAP